MKFKRLTAALSALAVVVSSAGGLPFGGLRLFDTSVVASAEEKSVTFTATGTQDGITVSCRAYMRDSFFVNGSASKLTISSGSENITKLEITDSAMYPDRFTESHITVSAGNKSIQGGVLTVTDINAKSVTLSATDNKYWTTNKIVVYYGESAVDPVYTITIPESVNIDGGTAEFKAENVTLPDGAKINITVDGENTESGQTTFNAKNEAGNSTVSYTIKNGSADVADGGTALTFTEGGTQTLTFAKKADSTPTYAGKHTETLTFGVVLEQSEPATVAVSSFTIDNAPTEALFVNSTGTLTATVSPDNATDKTVVWSSSDPDYVSINAETGEYTVMGKKGYGSATITATATNGTEDTSDDVAATCTITGKVTYTSLSAGKCFTLEIRSMQERYILTLRLT